MTPKWNGIALAVALAFAAGAHAQAPQNIEKLKKMQVSGTDLNIPPVPQTGKNADVVLWSGDPFSVYSKPEKVWVDGALLFDRSDASEQWRTDFELGFVPFNRN